MTYDHPLLPYVDVHIVEPWTDAWRFRQERKLWYHIMQFQAGYGVFSHVEDLDAKLDAYERATELPITADGLRAIENRERITKHDVKARIEVFNEVAASLYDTKRWRREDDEAVLAGEYTPMTYTKLELAHVGMTSADVVDNLSLIQMVECTRRLVDLAKDSHRPGAVEVLNTIIDTTPMRGIKGPVGTQQDMLELFNGDTTALAVLEQHLCGVFGMSGTLNSVGQVYPRSIDLQVAVRVALAIEGRQPWRTIANGYVAMIVGYIGDQWNEGDVSTSVVRRVALPGVFLCCGAALDREINP
jgi:adenylosuccinate lyase